MGNTDTTSILVGLLALIIIITFFVMAYRLKRIMNAIEGIADIEFKKSGSTKVVKCPSCGTEFETQINRKEEYKCPNCHVIVCVGK